MLVLILPAACFVPGAPRRLHRKIPQFIADKDSILDVEFAKIVDNDNQMVEEAAPSPKSLLEYSLELDPQWKEARIPFVDFASNNRAIDCHLAFLVDLDGSTYGIGVPCDAAAAVTLEQNGKTTYMDPKDNEELVEIMASKLQEHLGDDVFLKNTPKILTIGGPLDKYTADWRETLFDETVDRESLVDDEDEGLQFFYDFMKKELGAEEFQKTLNECKEDDAGVDKDLLRLFDVPGLGEQGNNVQGIQEMLQGLFDPDQTSPFESIGQDLEHEGVALKLVGFHFNDDDKSYTLVTLLKPFIIVGKYNNSGGDERQDLKFELLTLQEEKLVIPRLEQICQKNLEEAGLSFS
jgi:hypothetical protein